MPRRNFWLLGPVQSWGVVALAWVAGVAVQLRQETLSTPLVYASFCAFPLVLLAFIAIKIRANRRHWQGLALVLAAFFLGLGSTGLRAQWQLHEQLDWALEGRDVDVQGTVQGLPQPAPMGWKWRLRVERAESLGRGAGQATGQAVRLPQTLEVFWWGGAQPNGEGQWEMMRAAPRVEPGQRWRLRLRLRAVHGLRNPHGWDAELWAWEQGVGAQGTVRAGKNDPAPQLLQDTWHAPVDQLRSAVRTRLYQTVEDTKAAALLAALAVGDQAALSRSDWEVFRATGTAHLVSISGMHVTLFAWLAVALLGRCWRLSARACTWMAAPTAAALGGVLLAWGYALFAGWGIPAQRTVLMLALVVGLRLSGLRWPWPLAWVVVLAAVVAWDPWALLQAGFWLSFVAVAVLFATDLGAINQGGTSGSGFFGSYLYGFFRVQGLITLALAPLGVFLFGQFSLVSLLANALAIPWVTLVLTPLSLLGAVWSPLWGWAQEPARGLVAAMGALAQWPGAQWWLARPPLPVALWAIAGAVLAVLPWGWRMRALALPWLLPLLLWRPAVPPPGAFSLLALDVGQGSAVLVRTTRHTLLYDAGPRWSNESDAGSRVVAPLLQALRWVPDALVFSHSDSDHTGGAAAVALWAPQATWWTSMDDSAARQVQRQPSVPLQRCVAGQGWEWDGVRFTFLHPQEPDYAQNAPKPNTMSCVLRVDNGQHSALLTGDLERAQELRLVQDLGSALAVDVLLVPHHGSKTSSSAAFLDAVRPRHAWVQAGYRNRYGHPAPPVVQRYRERLIALQDSAHCGAMHWDSQRPEAVRCEREQDARYWHHRAR